MLLYILMQRMHRVVQYLPTLSGPDRECLSRQVFLAYVGSVPEILTVHGTDLKQDLAELAWAILPQGVHIIR